MDPHPDPLHFAYRANHSVDDAVKLSLHFALDHLDSPGSHVRKQFVDFSATFNTFMPERLHEKLSAFITNIKQHVQLSPHI